MGAFDFPVQPRCAGLDVRVGDALVEHVPMEGGLEFGAAIGLDDLDLKRQALQHVVEELDGGGLVERRVDP
ncbi:hypothetical protein ACFFR9_35645 [Streptomyces spiralis]|uniref:hypothetical protein n=1 Tax=Streptomyces spiralis TaxID=66376 RepID=UPI003571650B